MLMGVNCGLVAITGNCAFVTEWAAVVIGALSPLCYALTLKLYDRLGIDDACETSPLHMPCGAFGLLTTAFFHTE